MLAASVIEIANLIDVSLIRKFKELPSSFVLFKKKKMKKYLVNDFVHLVRAP